MFESNDYDNNEFAHAKVVGVGGCGHNCLNSLIKLGLQDADIIAVNTDAQDLVKSLAPKRLQIGDKLTRGLGAGSSMEIGEQAALEAREDIINALGHADMVFIIAGLGGGTGSGAAPVIAQCAKEEIEALTVAIVTLPFAFEGQHRQQQAEESLAKLKEYADAVIVIPNDRLLDEKQLQENPPKPDFQLVDKLIYKGIRGILSLISTPGLINLDFADVRAVLAKSGTAVIGTGTGTGENAPVIAAREAAAFFLFNEDIEDAQNILISVAGTEENISMFEVTEAANTIHEMANSSANIIWGAYADNSLGDTVTVTIVASGFDHPTTSASPSAFNGNDYTEKIYKQMIDACLQRIQDPATKPAEVAELMRELRLTLKELS